MISRGRKLKKERYLYQRSLLGQLLLEIHFLITRFEGVCPGHFNEGILTSKESDKLRTIRMKTIELAQHLGESKLKNARIVGALDPSIPLPENYEEVLFKQIYDNLSSDYHCGQ